MIHDSLVEAKDNTNSIFEMNPTSRFLNQVNKYQKIMEHINEVTKHLQNQMHYLSIFQADFELIIGYMKGNMKMYIMNLMVTAFRKSIFHHHRQNSKIHILKVELLRFKIMTF